MAAKMFTVTKQIEATEKQMTRAEKTVEEQRAKIVEMQAVLENRTAVVSQRQKGSFARSGWSSPRTLSSRRPPQVPMAMEALRLSSPRWVWTPPRWVMLFVLLGLVEVLRSWLKAWRRLFMRSSRTQSCRRLGLSVFPWHERWWSRQLRCQEGIPLRAAKGAAHYFFRKYIALNMHVSCDGLCSLGLDALSVPN